MPYVPFLRFNTAQYSNQVVLSVSVVVLIVGFVSLLYGWKLYRIVVIVATALAGAYLGYYLAYGYTWCPEKLRLVVPIVLALAGGVLAIPLQKAAVFFVGASVGFVSIGPVAAHVIWNAPPGPNASQLILVSGIAFAVMGVLALLVFKPIVMIATSLFGATLAVSGGAQIGQTLWVPDKDVFAAYQVQLAAIYVVLSIVGVIFQAVTQGKKKQAK